MDCGIKCIKYLIFIFNLIMLVIGMALIVLGTLMETIYKEYFVFFSGKVNFASIFIICVGIIIFVIAFLGCCGASRQNYRMIVVYTLLLTLVILVQIAYLITVFYLRDEIENTLEMNMKGTIPEYNKDNEGVFHAWNQLQDKLMCCGALDYKDWKNHTDMTAGNTVPDSCCIENTKGCGSFKDTSKIHTQGCLNKLKKLIEDNVVLLGLVTGICAFFQILGIVIASCLAVSLKKEYETMK